MSGYAAQLMRRIEALDTAVADNRRRAEAYQRTERELKDVSASVTSPDGVVTVVAGPGGVVSSVTFSENVHDISPASLSTTVQQTISAAIAAVARRQADVVRRGLGSSELLDRVAESDERLFGDQRPKAPAEDLAPATSEAHAADDELFFEEFDIFESSEQ
jgi:DNA-binding protein YbaB